MQRTRIERLTNKERMQILLKGGIPDVPPTWELSFSIEKEFFGLDPEPVYNGQYPSQKTKDLTILDFQLEVFRRLVDEVGWAVVPAGYDPKAVTFFKKAIGNNALIAGYEGGGVFYMPSGTDIMDFVVRMFEHPKELLAEARRKCNQAKEHLSQLADAGVDFFVGAYDFGFNDAPFLSPEHFGEFVVPYLTEIVESAHEQGKKIILHSDGCLTNVLDQIYSTGIDGYHSVDPQGHMDIKQVREQYPDWLLMGNIACNMLQDANEQKIRQSVRYCMKYGGVGKRYIFSTSNCVFKGMPPESYRIMLDEYHRYIELYQ